MSGTEIDPTEPVPGFSESSGIHVAEVSLPTMGIRGGDATWGCTSVNATVAVPDSAIGDFRTSAAGDRPSFGAMCLKPRTLFHKRIELCELEEKPLSSDRALWNSARHVWLNSAGAWQTARNIAERAEMRK